jgi:excisionase family DNA binding protein
VDDRAEYLSIAEVATLLGVHRNTVRNRVKAGPYKAHKIVPLQGETYAILWESLGASLPDPTNKAAQPLSRPVHHNVDNSLQPATLVSPDQQAQADAIVQRLLAPFIAELGEVREDLGRVKAEPDQKDETIAELRRRAEVAEAELVREREAAAAAAEAHRRRLEQERQNRVAEENPQDTPRTPETPEEASQGLWARLGRWWRG